MSEQQWIGLLTEIPLVAAFILYSLKLTEQSKEEHLQHQEQSKMMQQKHLEQIQELQTRLFESLDKRDASFEKRTQALVETMNTNNRAVLDTLARMEANDRKHNDYVHDKLSKVPVESETAK